MSQEGLDFDSLPSLSTKEDFSQINDFLACTMREINNDQILNENGFDLSLALSDSYDSNAQLMSLPLDTFSTTGNGYLLNDNNDLYPGNYNPSVVTTDNLPDSAYPTVLTSIPTTIPTTSAFYNSNAFPSPPEEANNWTANDLFDQIIYDIPEVANPTTPATSATPSTPATSATSTATTTPQTFIFTSGYEAPVSVSQTSEYIDVTPELTRQKIVVGGQHNAPTKQSSSISKIEKELNAEKKDDISPVPKKEELPKSSKVVPSSCKLEGVVAKVEQDDMIDQLSQNLFDIDLNKPSPAKDNALRAKHAAIISILYKEINRLSKKLDEQAKEADKVKIEA